MPFLDRPFPSILAFGAAVVAIDTLLGELADYLDAQGGLGAVVEDLAAQLSSLLAR